MDFTQILYEVENKICTITLNRPDRMNAWTHTMKDEMVAAFDMADKDDDVRVIIVTGAGKAYCAGADLDRDNFEKLRKRSPQGEIHRDTAGELTLKIFDVRKPVIAAINGAAVGVGTTMTLAMDIRLASEKAKMGLIFNRRGLVPEGCCTWFLPRIMGFSKAAEWIYTGDVLSAREALAGGLVSQVYPPDELLPAARELAGRIAEKTSALSTAFARQMLWKGMSLDHPMEAHIIESRCLNHMFLSEDVKEGVESFFDKRPPRFPLKASADMPDFYPWWDEHPYDPNK
jgi:enoyl-CoA hydratase/carnithine racemase